MLRDDVADPRVDLATVTSVQVSSDLGVADVYVTTHGDQERYEALLEGLNSAEGRIRSGLARRVKLRITPVLRFHLDTSVDQGMRIYEALKDVPPPAWWTASSAAMAPADTLQAAAAILRDAPHVVIGVARGSRRRRDRLVARSCVRARAARRAGDARAGLGRAAVRPPTRSCRARSDSVRHLPKWTARTSSRRSTAPTFVGSARARSLRSARDGCVAHRPPSRRDAVGPGRRARQRRGRHRHARLAAACRTSASTPNARIATCLYTSAAHRHRALQLLATPRRDTLRAAADMVGCGRAPARHLHGRLREPLGAARSCSWGVRSRA